MRTTTQFLDDVKARYGIESDYGLAKKLGLSKQAVSRYRLGQDVLGARSALAIGEALDLDPAYVLACATAEREGSGEMARKWAEIARRLAAAAMVLLGIGIGAPEGRAGGFDRTSLSGPGGNTHSPTRKRRRRRPSSAAAQLARDLVDAGRSGRLRCIAL